MDLIIKAAQLILGLSFLVGVHELGHMLTAKFFGMRVEKFSIGFPPKLFGFKKGETEYSVGAIPLGGFVKISGMVDESLDTEAMKAEPQPWEFRSKPAWQRLIVMLGGVIVNVLVAFIISIGLLWIVGEEDIRIEELNKYGIVAQPIAKEIGLQTGDRIKAVNGKEAVLFSEVAETLINENSSITIIRNGEEKVIPVPSNVLDKLAEKDASGFISVVYKYKVGQVIKDGRAAKGGLKAGDSILSINGTAVPYFHLLKGEFAKNKNNVIDVAIIRDKKESHLSIQVDSAGMIGIELAPIHVLQETTRQYTFLESVPKGIVNSVKVITDQIKAFSKIFRGELKASNSVGSFFSIADAYGPKWEWSHFWSLTATLSMVLAFMNLLPIPALDGGHVMFILYEIISGRKPSDKFLENAQKVGMVILLTLMLYAISNDAIRHLF
ncbi:RIP metalloprotease RseP [Cytophaga aurantiaca]|uniref:RIP metalloprotease RseP n=1 Tax=Cytophaga aurantiaca TaxID=29530 RepID=UPI0003692529|nr:RIP metalloprotease RseP [Cytophaga aurantiaca]